MKKIINHTSETTRDFIDVLKQTDFWYDLDHDTRAAMWAFVEDDSVGIEAHARVSDGGTWFKATPDWSLKNLKYRVVKNEDWVPYTAKRMQELLGRPVVSKHKSMSSVVTSVTKIGECFVAGNWYSPTEMFTRFTYLDGGVIGEKVAL